MDNRPSPRVCTLVPLMAITTACGLALFNVGNTQPSRHIMGWLREKIAIPEVTGSESTVSLLFWMN